jgi:hypothetical protein|tara:strand:+ start:1563 stop:1973 length:411 start_codon:yes stop_codon:yes gene_type:complete
MNKLFLTMLFSVATIVASAQMTVMTTVTEVEDEYNFTDNLAVGYNVSDILMLGLEMDGEDNYEVMARYAFADNCWAYGSFDTEGEGEYVDRLDLGVGYSFNIWEGLYIDPNYTVSMKKNSDDEYEGKLNFTISYKF